MTAIYRKRISLFKRGETEWRVEDDGLVRRNPDGSGAHLIWADVRWVRLRYNPSLAKPWMHILTVATSRGSITVNNAHFAGIGYFENRSAAYSLFVRAALERIAALSPQAQVYLGSTLLSFVAQIGLLGIALIGLTTVLIVLPLPTGAPISMIANFFIVVASLPLVWRWARKNRPRTGDFRRAVEDLPAS